MIRSYILALAFLIMFVSGCGNKSSVSQKAAKNVEKAIGQEVDDGAEITYKQEVQKFKLEGFSKTGENQWAVQGEFANIVEPDVILKSLKGTSFSKQVSATITAERGIYNKDTRCAELKGNVVVNLSDGGKVYMDHASWNASEEEIKTDSPIKIEHSGVVLDGVGATVKPQQEWAIVDKSIKLSDSKGRVITCDGPLEVDYKNKRAILNNNVVINDPQGTVSSDKVIAYFNADKREIEKIEWVGNVKAVY